jgi:hypothetical protein
METKIKRPIFGTAARARGVTAMILAIFLTAMVGAGTLLTCQQRMASTGLYRRSYEGRILNKSATFRERQIGSAVRFLLLVQGNDGDQIEVAVDQDLYERAQIGMWIKKDDAGVRLDTAAGGSNEDLKK